MRDAAQASELKGLRVSKGSGARERDRSPLGLPAIAPPMNEAALQKLISLAQDGDTDAFGRMYDHFFTPVYRYCAFRLPKEVAEDTTADIFVKAWEKLHTYKIQKGVPFAAWIFRIARHAVIDTYRTHRGFEEVPDTIPDGDSLNRAESRLQRKDTLRIVRAALDRLSPRYREVLLLTYVSELPYSEVSRVLHMSEGAVRILKLRALRKLEAILPPEMDFEL
ncbi:MAG TPA: sigma-70 family RNA polymerase sigma factor [Candidatus Peribacteraceae bacterium]|nr:sigma-70 family RNA polymerase sigma factor [Candidatus Peribacteraceae bacterium]